MAIYLLHGDSKSSDPLLLRRRLDALLDGIDIETNLNFQKFDLNESGTSFHDVATSAMTIPFLGGQRVVVATGVKTVEKGFKASDDEKKDTKAGSSSESILRSVKQLEHLPDDALLILVEENDHLDGRTAFYRGLKKAGCKIEVFKAMWFDPAGGNINEAIEYIQAEASRLGIRLDHYTARAFAERVGADRGAIEKELQKLALYSGAGASPTVEDVKSVVTESYEAGIFQLVDYIGYGNTGKALKELDDLMDRGAAAPYILTMIARQLRMIVQVREAIEDGASRNDQALAGQLKINPFVVRKILKQVEISRNINYKKMLEYLMETDIRLKRGTMTSKVPGKLALEILITHLAGARSVPREFEPSAQSGYHHGRG